MPKIPDSTKNSLHLRLVQRARARWPELADVRMRYRAGFAYVDGVLADGEVLPLCRLRYLSSATIWGFAVYRTSHDDDVDHCRAPPMLAQAHPAITARALGCDRERRARCPQLSGGGPTGAVSPRRAT